MDGKKKVIRFWNMNRVSSVTGKKYSARYSRVVSEHDTMKEVKWPMALITVLWCRPRDTTRMFPSTCTLDWDSKCICFTNMAA